MSHVVLDAFGCAAAETCLHVCCVLRLWNGQMVQSGTSRVRCIRDLGMRPIKPTISLAVCRMCSS